MVGYGKRFRVGENYFFFVVRWLTPPIGLWEVVVARRFHETSVEAK